MSETKLGITIFEDKKKMALTFTNDEKQSIAEIHMDMDGLAQFIGQLMAVHARLQTAPDVSLERAASGYAKLPAPIEYLRMITGRSTKSGLPRIAFEIGSEIWIGFVLQHPDAEGLSKTLQKYLANPQGDQGTAH